MTSTTNLVANLNVNMNVNTTGTVQQHGCCIVGGPDRLQFHERCGTLVKLSCNNRTAERRRPLDEFNNGVVMTHRPLRDNELFEVCKCVNFFHLKCYNTFFEHHFYSFIFMA